jgi:hypothetical protein
MGKKSGSFSVADLGTGAFLTPGSGMGKKSDHGSATLVIFMTHIVQILNWSS